MGTSKLSGKPDKMLGGGGVTYNGLASHPKETGISSGSVGHLACVQTFLTGLIK